MAKDPYKYFRVEARELLEGLGQGVLQLEKGSANSDDVGRLLRFAHTLKGAARVVKQPAIAELAHTIEGQLEPHRDSVGPLDSSQASRLLELLDQIAAELAALDPAGVRPRPAPRDTAAAPAEEPLETLRVEILDMDALLGGVIQADVQLGSASQGVHGLQRLRELARTLVEQLTVTPGVPPAQAMGRARGLADEVRSDLADLERRLVGDLGRVQHELGEIRRVAHRVRLIPAHTVFPALDRAVRDAAQSLGKRVDFEATGGDVRLDAHVLAGVREALMQVTRNAVAHGVESERERTQAGKPPVGRVRLEVTFRRGRVSFGCHDDGRGVDLAAVKRAAIARGVVTPAEAAALSTGGILALLRTGGLTTSGAVTELSGRGIGLDVVQSIARRLKGSMTIESVAGVSTTVELEVPISLASLQGLLVESAGETFAIPLDAVRCAKLISDSDVVRAADREAIVHEGKVIPFLPLERVLRRAASTGRQRRSWSAVVIEAEGKNAAIAVDRLLGTAGIVMRALPPSVDADPVVSGASLDAEGNPQLLLDPIGLLNASERGTGSSLEAPAVDRAPVLVIDDSLTTRMLEQSILESAGYQVEVAVSAEDGLSKARAARHSLFIVDVEMPGMDGFEFVALTRADPILQKIPAILVTSRDAASDRRRGQQVGAHAYIVKGEFDQVHLLHTIRELIG